MISFAATMTIKGYYFVGMGFHRKMIKNAPGSQLRTETMINSALNRLSLVKQITLLMLLLGALGIVGMSIASWMAQSIQGNAHAINKAGSLRMQSYRLLASLPLTAQQDNLLRQIEADQNSAELSKAINQEGLQGQYAEMQAFWQQSLKPQLQQAQQPQQAKTAVVEFVRQLDDLVAALDHKTEYHLALIASVQAAFSALTLLVLGLTIYFLRLRLHRPWRRLLAQAKAITHGDFNQRYPRAVSKNPQASNEMDVLGESLNRMSTALAEMIDNLAQRVEEKTASLQQKNQVLDFLYRVSQRLHTNQSLTQKLQPVLNELQSLTPLRAIQMRLYENNSAEFFQAIDSQKPLTERLLLGDAAPLAAGDTSQSLSWSLHDGNENCGLLLAQLPQGESLSADHQQLISTLLEQLTSALTLDRQTDNQQQLMLMEERATIARELHDSLAQSLSCLKIQVACLQMQAPPQSEESSELIRQMREELNTAYRQLRELLTTFRLKLSTPGLHSALQHTVDEFSQRLGFAISFDYQLPPRAVSASQGVHLLHIAREALNNIYKHAAASEVTLSLYCEDDEIQMEIVDNGCGLPAETSRQHHYGLIIMQDRANSLQGECQILPRASGGTRVKVHFHPKPLPFTSQEQV